MLDAGRTVEQKLQVLQHQNQRLAVQLEEKRKETKILEDRVSQHEKKEQEYAQTLLCVNRLWEQLHTDLQHMCTMASAGSSGTADEDGPQQVSLVIRDPFLRRLLLADPKACKAAQDRQKQMDAEHTVVEQALQERCRSTQALLAKLLTTTQQVKDAQNRMAVDASQSALDEELRKEVARMTTESSNLRHELDALRAAQRPVEEQLNLAEDRQLELEDRIKKLQNELADTEQELSNVQRKLFALKNNSGAGAGGSGGGAAPGASNVGRQGHGEEAGTSEDVGDLQQLLIKRAAEIEKEKEAHVKLSRELQELNSRLQDENWVPNSKTYQSLAAELSKVNEALLQKCKEADTLTRERDEAVREAQVKSYHYSHAVQLKAQVESLQRQYRDLQFQKSEVERARQDMELQLHREREKQGHSRSVQELKGMISTLQAEISGLQQHIKLNKVTVDRLNSAAADVASGLSRLEAKESEVQRLQDALVRKEGELEEGRRREALVKERIGDLEAFVEVLTLYCNDSRPLADLRASEVALKKQVAQLELQLQGHELQGRIRELEASERGSKDQIDLMALEADNLRLEISGLRRQLAELAAQLEASRAECQLYINEIEATGQAYEDMQSQNMRLLAQLNDRDEANNQLVAEKIKLSQSQSSLGEALDQARQEAERLGKEVAEAAGLREGLEREVVRLAGEMAQTKEALRSALSRAEGLALELRRREEQQVALAAQLEAALKQVEALKASGDELAEKAAKEKNKKQRLEEDNKVLQARVERLKKVQAHGGVAKELQDEIDAMRQLLNCNVCHERRKNVIITKCCHVFCDKCIKRNLEARNRKCPGCGVPFGQADVKNFFFT